MKLQATFLAGLLMGLLVAQALKSAAILLPVLGVVTGIVLYKLKSRRRSTA